MKIDSNKLSSNAANNSFLTLMGTPNGITELPITQLIETKNQPFKVDNDERMETLIEDIKLNGVLEPVIVIQENDKYRILAGHRRTYASKLAGRETVPCIIKNVASGTEKLIITNTNLTQRKAFSPSELAKAYKLQLEGYLEINANSVRTTAQLADENNVSKRTIQYYLKLNDLIPELLDLVDKEIISVKAGAQLTKLSVTEQNILRDYLIGTSIKKVDLNYAVSITQQSEKVRKIDIDYLDNLFFPKKVTKPQYSTYIVNNRDIDDTLFKVRQKILLLDNSEKLKKGIVLKNTDYQKLKAAQQKIEQQFNVIEKIIGKV